jgi:hypothetical protein
VAEATFTRAQGTTGAPVLLAWWELAHVDLTGAAKTYAWSDTPAAHPASYFGGYKDPRVATYGTLSRSASARFGSIDGFAFAIELADPSPENALRRWLTQTHQKYVRKRDLIARLVGYSAAGAGADPRMIGRGRIVKMTPAKGTVRFEAEDPVTSRLTRTMPRTIPSAVTTGTIGSIVNVGTAVPVVYGTYTDAATPGGGIPGIYFREIIGSVSEIILSAHGLGALTSFHVNGVDVLASGDIFSAGVQTLTHTDDGKAYDYYIVGVTGTTRDVVLAGGPVQANGSGVRRNGGGAVIALIGEQYHHFLNNFILPDEGWRTGDWFTDPTGPDPAAPKFTDGTQIAPRASFDALDTRLATIHGGAVNGRWIATAARNARDWLARLNLNAQARAYVNRMGQFAVTPIVVGADLALPALAAALAPVETYTDILDIVDDSFLPDDFPQGEDLCNKIRYVALRNYQRLGHSSGVFEGWFTEPTPADWQVDTTQSDAVSIAKEQDTKDQFIEVEMLASSAHAATAVARYLTQWAFVRRATFRVGLHGVMREIGDIIRVTHAEGPGAGGWVGKVVQIEGIAVNLDSFEVALTVRDLFAETILPSSFGLTARQSPRRRRDTVRPADRPGRRRPGRRPTLPV